MPSSASTPAELYALSLHDALPISRGLRSRPWRCHSSSTRQTCLRSTRGTSRIATWGTPHETAGANEPGPDAWFGGGCPKETTAGARSEEHTSELQSRQYLVCRLLLARPPSSTLFPYTTLFRSRGVFDPVPGGATAPAHVKRVFDRLAALRALPHGAHLMKQPVRTNRVPMPGSAAAAPRRPQPALDRKSTRLNSSHANISYAVFC